MSTDKKERISQMEKGLIYNALEAERDFINDFSELIEEPMKKVPEVVFREIFLPYFLGEKKSTNDTNAIAHWIGLVGGPSEPAEVVDIQGNTVFVVPGLFDTARVNIDSKSAAQDKLSFEAIFKIATEESRVHPMAGIHYMAQKLDEKLKTHIKEPSKAPHSWQPILEYYKLAEPAASKPTASAPEDDGFNFD